MKLENEARNTPNLQLKQEQDKLYKQKKLALTSRPTRLQHST